jgi:hypothetical protein
MGDVGKAYENFALATIRPGTPIPENTRRFFSSARKRETNGKLENVVPDFSRAPISSRLVMLQ